MTALPVSGAVRQLASEPQGVTAFFSALRKVAAKVNHVEPKRVMTKQGQSAARANAMLREHAAMLPTL